MFVSLCAALCQEGKEGNTVKELFLWFCSGFDLKEKSGWGGGGNLHNGAYITADVFPGINANYSRLASGGTRRLHSHTASGVEWNPTHKLKMSYSVIFRLWFHLQCSEVS